VPAEGLALGITGPGRAALLSVPVEPAPEGGFAAEVVYSGISAGTELTYLKGTNPYLSAGWDPELGVFRDDRPAVGYPITRLGYMEVARVTESRTHAAAEGDLVALACGHRTHVAVDPARDRFVTLPPGLDPVLGIYVAHMGPICANGVLHAAADLAGPSALDLGDGVRGRTVLVTGAGVVGLLVALFAAHHGAAEVAVADVTPERLAVAERLGLLAIDERQAPAWRLLKERWRHGPADRGADVAFQCRGQVAVLAGALRAMRPQGTVVDLAFYQGGADALRLGEEFHHNGLSLRCAQIGRVPRGLAHAWDRRRLSQETIALLEAAGEPVRRELVTDLVPLDEGPELLAAIADRRRHVLQAVLAMPSA
jgi:threonine dehydrogenase-like Zn-dependent dehydrogenase